MSPRVESESSAIKFSAPGGVFLQAPAGSVDLNADDDIRLQSKYGSVSRRVETASNLVLSIVEKVGWK